MANAIAKSTKTGQPRPTFAAAHAEWLRARTTIAELNAHRGPDKRGDAPMSAALDAFAAAEWKLLRTPACSVADVRERARIVMEMFATADTDGEPTDNRHRLMLSTLVNEICSPLL